MSLNIRTAQRVTELAAYRTAKLDSVTIVLVKADLTDEELLDYATVLTVGNEAAFNGYARLTAQSFLGPIIADDESVIVLSPNLVFSVGTAGSDETIRAYVVMPDTVDAVVYAEKLPAPQRVTNVGDAVAFVSRFSLEVAEGELARVA